MTETANLQIKVDSKGVPQAEKGLKRLEQQSGRTERASDRLENAIGRAGGAIAAYFTVNAAIGVLKIADAFNLMQKRVERLADNSEDAAAKYKALTDIAVNTGADIRETVRLWETLDQTLGELGKSDAQILQMTDTLQKLGVVGGSSAEEMSNSMRQFGQAMAGGILRAEEFNSIIENTPEVGRTMARGMGISMGEMRQAMLDGKLTADTVFNALMDQTEHTNGEFDKMPRTIDMASQALKTNFGNAVARLDKQVGASSNLIKLIDWTASEMAVFQNVIDPGDELIFRKTVEKRDKLVKRLRETESKDVGFDPFGLKEDRRNEEIPYFKKKIEEYNRLIKEMSDKRKQSIIDTGKKDDSFGGKIDPAGGKFIEDLKERNQTELQLLQEKYSEEKSKLDGFLASESITKAQHLQGMADLDADYQAKKDALDQKEVDAYDRKKKATDDWLETVRQRNLDELSLLDEREQEEITKLEEYRQQKLISEQAYTDAMIEIGNHYTAENKRLADERKKAELQSQHQILKGATSLFGSMADITGEFAGEQSGLYKAMFAASKAFAIADSIVKIQQGVANAAAMPFPANLGAMATVAASTMNIVSTISSTNLSGARAEGGQVVGGSSYLVGERGPEVLTMPGGQNGSITPNHKLNSVSGKTTVVVNNYSGEQTEENRTTDSDGNEYVEIIIGRLNDDVSRGVGFGGTLEHTYGLNRRL